MAVGISLFQFFVHTTDGPKCQQRLAFCSNPLDRISIKRSVLGGGFVSRNMAELVKTSAFRNGSGSSNIEEDGKVLEQEALVDGSSKLVAAGLESTINRLSKWLVSGLFGVIIIWRHDSEALWATMGSVINSALAMLLKQILNQERPAPTLKSDPGMPSSHAQSIFFIGSFIILSVVEWLGINEATLMISGLTLAIGSYLTWLRVSQQLHTISQVVVGAAVGSTFSLLWFFSWKAFVLEAFNSNLSVQIIVALAAAAFCVSFGLYVIKHWLKDE